MRSPLQTFTDFANTLLPHETQYLLSIQRFEDEQRLAILQKVDFNAKNIDQFTPYDAHIDKRKYNHLQNWIKSRLKAIDVDEQFSRLLELEQKILVDGIEEEDERELLHAIKSYQHPNFFFTRFYEVVNHYRHFLLIRLRYADHQRADDFLKKHAEHYKRTGEVYERLHEATMDIVNQYSGEGTESKKWEKWLKKAFYNENLEGYLRYLALVRLTFICHNYRKFDLVREKFDYLDQKFFKGQYYSKRMLLNYYNNRLMLHSSYQEYDLAVYYGYLSVRSRNHDHLLYVNNLCAVLLRLSRFQEALQLMKNASSVARKTRNFHNRIGYVAFYMEALIKNGMYKNALGYGDSMLKAYSKEIVQYRWHLFFSVYLATLMHLKQYEKLLKTVKKYKLLERDEEYCCSAGYLPTIPLYHAAAKYREGLMEQAAFQKQLDETVTAHKDRWGLTTNMKNLVSEMIAWIPEVSNTAY
ncbi:MAG: hypothetical protein R2792_12180 [Saprospiraceae bacterium]|jgi:hypothetical protein